MDTPRKSRGKSVNLWHPWQDQPGMSYPLTYWKDGRVFDENNVPLFAPCSAEAFASYVARNKLFVVCQDILSLSEFTWSESLLALSTPYLSSVQNILALNIAEKKRHGYVIQGSTWKWEEEPGTDFLAYLKYLFAKFGFQASTYSSLSEKVLRATLPAKFFISRPAYTLRWAILNHHKGGRIDEPETGLLWKFAYQYDRIKAYLACSQSVPTPFIAPFFILSPTLDACTEFSTGFWECQLVVCPSEIAPIQLEGKKPVSGEVFTQWLWTEELLDCLEAGYQLVEIRRGYGWVEMSDFLCQWVDVLWNAYMGESDPYVRKVIKSMMVGLPGRFLRKPEHLMLVPLAQAKDGSPILTFHHTPKQGIVFSNYAVESVPDLNSTALSPQGSYIVMKQRQNLYHMMRDEVRNGNVVIRSYIDMYTTARKTTLPWCIGENLGDYKEVPYKRGYAEKNLFIGENADGLLDMKAPGLDKDGEQRIKLYQRYHAIVEQNS